MEEPAAEIDRVRLNTGIPASSRQLLDVGVLGAHGQLTHRFQDAELDPGEAGFLERLEEIDHRLPERESPPHDALFHV